MRTTLSFRLIGFYATVATLTVFLTLWVGSSLIWKQMVATADLILENESEEVGLLLSDVDLPHSPEAVRYAVEDHTQLDAGIFYFEIESRGGEELFRSENLGGDSLPEPEAAERIYDGALSFRLSGQKTPGGMPVRVGQYELGEFRCRLGTSLDTQLDARSQVRRLALASIPAVFGVSLLVGYALSWVMLRPLRSIQETAQRITGANLRERIVVPESSDEISRLARLLNDTFDRLEKAFEQVRRFAGDCSHELKTPLTVVRLQTEKVLEGDVLAAEERAALEEALGEMGRLEKVIQRLLLLAQTEAEALPLNRKETSTADFLRSFAEGAEILADEGGCRFELVGNADAVGSFDPSWIRQVLFNLLTNAIKYSPSGGRIRLRGEIIGKEWRVEIEDEGDGVAEEELEAMFERFNKVGAGPGKQPGTGLGLAVCKGIVEQHGGSIRAVARSAEKGFHMVWRLPLES